MMKDQYDLPISIENAQAVSAWLAGLQAGFSFDSSGIPELKSAVEIAPNFALAHAALARQLSIHGKPTQAQASIHAAARLASGLSEREISQIDVLKRCLLYHPQALPLALAHLAKWPLDILVLSLVVGPFGLLAFSGKYSWRQDSLALLESYQKRWPQDDWWYLSALGFALTECGRLDQAIVVSEQAWEIMPTGNCAHALSHLHFEQGDAATGQAFLMDWRRTYGRASDMSHHLAWHDALYQLDQGSATKQSMTDLFASEFDPKVSDPMPLTTFSDNASILWRCFLADISLDEDFIQSTQEYADLHFPSLGFIFADVHRVLITVLSRSDQKIADLKSRIQLLEEERSANYLNNLLIGASAFADRDFRFSADSLESTVSSTVLMGGSNPQRAIVEQTYLRAKQLTRENP